MTIPSIGVADYDTLTSTARDSRRAPLVV